MNKFRDYRANNNKKQAWTTVADVTVETSLLTMHKRVQGNDVSEGDGREGYN